MVDAQIVWHFRDDYVAPVTEVEVATPVAKQRVALPTNEVDRIFAVVGEIVVAASGMNDSDARRVENCVLAAGDLLVSRARLKNGDRQAFEKALRDAVARRNG